MIYTKYLIKKKWFSLEEVDRKLSDFQYSPEDNKDKPLPISSNKFRIIGGAWQIWSLMRLFFFIVGKKVKDFNDPVWQTILLLSEIVEIVCAPTIHKTHISYLKALIDQYLTLRSEYFPAIPLRPKHHYLSHYPELMLEFGPLIKVWTLRFETKHMFFKKVIRSAHNFLNVTKTLNEKHELFQSLLRQGSHLRNVIDIRDSVPFVPEHYSKEIQSSITRRIVTTELEDCTSVTVKGTTYKKGNAVIIKQDEYQYNLDIGRVCLILSDFNGNVYLVVEELKTTFHPGLRICEVKSQGIYVCIAVNELFSYYPLHIYVIDTKKYVRLRHAIVNCANTVH